MSGSYTQWKSFGTGQIDRPCTRVLLPAEKAELAQLEKRAHGATFALFSEDLAPAYPMPVR